MDRKFFCVLNLRMVPIGKQTKKKRAKKVKQNANFFVASALYHPLKLFLVKTLKKTGFAEC